MIYHSGYIRQKVYARDRGRCKVCGINCTKAYKEWCAARSEAHHYLTWLAGHHRWKRMDDFYRLNGQHMSQTQRNQFEAQIRREMEIEMERLVPNPGWTTGRSTGWDADHIIPVVEGGLKLGLDNLRTLCHPCHKKETAALAARLAAATKTAAGHPAHPELFPPDEQTTTRNPTRGPDPKPAEPAQDLP